MGYHCGPCKDTGYIGGDRYDGPDARWCTCAAACQLQETEPNYVVRLNDARAKLRARFSKPGLRRLADVVDDEYKGEF